jgi:PAS domain S-box-containing protein
VKSVLQTNDPELLDRFQARLSWRGLEAVVCRDLEQAWHIAQRECPALYILQWNRDDAAALDFCRRIRTEPDGHLSTIWLITDRDPEGAIRAALDSGVDDCLSLPIDWQWLDVRLGAVKRRISDATDRQRVEESLRRSNERFDVAVRGANEGLWDAVILPGLPWDSLETPVWYSPRYKELLGYGNDEFPNIRRSWASRLHPDDQPRVLEALADHVQRRIPYDVEYRLRTKSGEFRWFSARGLGVWNEQGEMVRMAGSIRDVTDAHRTADALKTSEEKWRGLVEHAPDHILVVDREARIQFINRVAPGYRLEDVLGACAYDFCPPDDRPRLRAACESVLQTGKPEQIEVAVARPDGGIDWYLTRLGPIQLDGQVESIVMITTNTTDRRLVEEERQKFFALVENSGDFIGMLTNEGELLYLNPGGCRMVGIKDATEARSLPLADLLTEESQKLFGKSVLPSVGATGRWSGEMQFRHRHTGRVVEVHQKMFQVRHPQSGDPLSLATITRDISDRKRTEALLVREQEFLRRLLDLQERDRQLVAYEIHDGLVQEMTGALMHLEAFKHADDPQQRERDFDRGTRLLREAVNEARRLISGLRPPVLDELGIIAAIEYLINEIRRDLGEIEFVHRTSFDRLVPALESAIFRIVQEALNNVRKHSDSRRARVELYENANMLRLIIRDWGRGFDPKQVSRERFGLQGIRQRARLLGTTAVIDSTPGKGTVITVDLPKLRAEEDNESRAPPNGQTEADVEAESEPALDSIRHG